MKSIKINIVSLRGRRYVGLAMTPLVVTLLLGFLSFSLAQAQTVTNLLTNGDFETGATLPWEGITNSRLTTADVHSGNYAMNIVSNGPTLGADGPYQRWINVTPGKTYVFVGWFKWTAFGGAGWGYDTFGITNDDWTNAGGLMNMHASYEINKWHKLAVTFIPKSSRIQVGFGMFGPRENLNFYFDDIMLFEKAGNLPPEVDPRASMISGNVPLTVQFTANGLDMDGAIRYYSWDFGDGSLDTIENPAHTFTKRGNYTISLGVWDNEGATTQASLNIQVADNAAPTLILASPSGQGTFNTDQTLVILSGTALASSGRTIISVNWDNVNTGSASSVGIIPAQTVAWDAGSIALKPGKNEIFLTIIDNTGAVETGRITVNKQANGPIVSNIQAGPSSLGLYDKYEVTFDLETVADNTFFKYDENPPFGIEPGIGVSVEGIFRLPSGQTLRQPGFYKTEVTRSGSGTTVKYEETNNKHWAVRFAPQEVGEYQVSLYIRDAFGEIAIPVGNFTAGASIKKGFVKVSKDDPRYFEFSNGELFWPGGPAWEVNGYVQYKDTGINLERPWMGGWAAYSTNWSRWMNNNDRLGNEGVMAPLNYKQRYPSHELSRNIYYPQGFRIWLSCFGDGAFCAATKPHTTYQYKIRFKSDNISGPRDNAYSYGFTVRIAESFLSHETPLQEAEDFLRTRPILLSHVTNNRPWHTVVGTFRTGSSVVDSFNLYLDNVTSGQVYIDEFSVKEARGDAALGPELIRQYKSDLHTYVDQRPAAYFDWQVEQGEQNGVFFKYVVQDKNDWVPNHLLRNGIFFDAGDGYYQEDGTKAKWLQQQWWRYLIARWGYSPAVHSWELNNEGAPGDQSNYRQTQDFARFMHQNDSHPHLAATSFWAYVQSDFPNFWGNKDLYPDVDYADIHKYSDGDALGFDLAEFQNKYSSQVGAFDIGKPVLRGETGIAGIGEGGVDFFSYLTRPNTGIWYHNFLWAQLNPGGLMEFNYWFPEHFYTDPAFKQNPIFIREDIHKVFYKFTSSLDINKGGYVDVAAGSTNANLRVYGQKNIAANKAHLWIQNKDHTWRNVMGIENPVPVNPQSGVVTIAMNPDTEYQAEWWNTYTGVVSRNETLRSDLSGNLALVVTSLSDDTALKITSSDPIIITGDINNDTQVNVLDIQACVNHILGIQDLGNRADVNGDGSVNVLDVQAIVNIILRV